MKLRVADKGRVRPARGRHGFQATVAVRVALALLVAGLTLPGAAVAEQASQPSSPAAAQLDAGAQHTCAVNGGRVFCWGSGSGGRLGYGNTNSIGDNEKPGAAGPVNLGGRAATAITAGDFHTCALLDDGNVRCWGFGGEGRLGYGDTEAIGDDETPDKTAPVSLGGPATAISAGGAHTCAVLVGGNVRCWGYGLDGRLGYPSTDPIGIERNNVGDDEPPSSLPPVDLEGAAIAISAGREHTCAVLTGGSVRCWGDPGGFTGGDGGDGRLGYANPFFIGDDETPSGRALLAVACPSATQCTAVDNIGQQVTFNPTAPGTPTPTTIDLNRAHTGVACPSTTQCTAVDTGGRQVTFNPTAPGTPTPTTIVQSRILTAVACPSTTQCTAVDNTGRQVTFNPAAPGTPTPTTIAPNRAFTSVACPSTTQCTAVDGAGRQVTFNPTAPGTPAPTAIDARHGLRAVACPSTAQCTAVGSAGQQVTFNPAAPGTPTPTRIDATAPVSLGGAATAITAGDWHSCAVLTGGSVRCWGLQNPGGRLGYFNRTDRGVGDHETPASAGPVELGAGRTATGITAGNHTCARLDDATVRCWGPGGAGRLGYGTTDDIGDDESPASVGPVNLGGRAAAVSAGGAHTCARLEDTSVRCWGEGADGRLGYGNTADIGDNETPAAAGPVDFRRPPRTTRPPSRPPVSPADPEAAALAAQATRLRGLRSCLAKAKRHSRREIRRARRLPGSRGLRARRHAKRHARKLRRACLKRWARTPGKVTELGGRAASAREIVLTFNAAGTDGSRPPAAQGYVVKQSRRPIRTARAFRRADSLCGGTCRFPTAKRVGGPISLRVTDLRPRTSYFYAVAARDNVSRRVGPFSRSPRVRTR